MRSVSPVSGSANHGQRWWATLEQWQQSDSFGETLKAEFPSLFDL
jgi:hypothetical protein